MNAINRSGASMSEWKPFTCRVSLFPAQEILSSSLPSALQLYRQIWAGDPDSFHKQEDPLRPMVAQGKRGGLIVNCLTQPARIDFTLRAAETPSTQRTVALIVSAIELRAEVVRIIDSLDSDIVSNLFSRVALILSFAKLEPNHVEANRALTKVIPDRYGVTLTDEEDFIFQINQPRVAKEIPHIKMNFITRWSVDRIQTFNILFPIGGVLAPVGMSPPSPKIETFIAPSVTFDNNNVPDRALTGKQQSALLREALDAAVEMQRKIGLNIGGL